MANRFSYLAYLTVALVAGVAILMATSGCQLSTPISETDQNTPTVEATATTRPSRTPTVETTPTVAATETPEDSTMTLTVWTIESISPEAQGDSGNFISNNLRNFRRVNPNIKVDMQAKMNYKEI